MTSHEVLSRIEAAEGHVRSRVFDQDQASISKVVSYLSGGSASPSVFTPQIILRLATVLRRLGKGLRYHRKDGNPLFEQAQEVLDVGLGLAWYPSNIRLLN